MAQINNLFVERINVKYTLNRKHILTNGVILSIYNMFNMYSQNTS